MLSKLSYIMFEECNNLWLALEPPSSKKAVEASVMAILEFLVNTDYFDAESEILPKLKEF